MLLLSLTISVLLHLLGVLRAIAADTFPWEGQLTDLILLEGLACPLHRALIADLKAVYIGVRLWQLRSVVIIGLLRRVGGFRLPICLRHYE